MSYLIFCSFEVGGFPFRIAEILNRHGFKTYYLSLDKLATGHNSTKYHFGDIVVPWDISHRLPPRISDKDTITHLQQIKADYSISGCLATGGQAYLLKKAGIAYNYWCYGSDLDLHCFAPVWPRNFPLWRRIFHYAVSPLAILLIKQPVKLPSRSLTKYCQFWDNLIRTKSVHRASIRLAEALTIAPYQRSAYLKLCPQKKLVFLPHFVKTIPFEELKRQKEKSKADIYNRTGIKRFVFSSTRHVWGPNFQHTSDNKGSDIILHAFARYLNCGGDIDMILFLINKGYSVTDSKKLSIDLGIADHIIWLDEMKSSDLISYYQGAELCFGQFGTPVLAYTAIEPMTQGTPCISYYHDDSPVNIPFYPVDPPIFNCKEPKEISTYLKILLSDVDQQEKRCYSSWSWVNKYCSETFFAKSLTESLSEYHE